MERIEPGTRVARPESIRLPTGYRIEPVAVGLNYPTSITWEPDGSLLIAESSVPFGRVARTETRISRLEGEGRLQPVASGFQGLINDIAYHDGRLYISQQGKISVLEKGQVRDLISGLPSWGLHENNALAFGPDGRLYFGQGTVSNAGVIDSFALERLRRAGRLQDHDIPGADVVLTGQNYETVDLQTRERQRTGAFSPWGKESTPGQRVPGARPGQAANGSVMSANADGSDLRVFAWGLRNPYGIAFAPDGRLYVANNGANRIPPRRISSDPDTLWLVEEGVWYGWPDFFAGYPATDPAFKPPDAPRNEPLIANHEELLGGRSEPPKPVVPLGLHVCPCKFDFVRDPGFGFVGQAVVPEYGSILAPEEGLQKEAPAGHKVVRIDPARRTVDDLVVNHSGLPASATGNDGGLERPIQARVGPDGALYIVDWGLLVWQEGWEAIAGTGIVWKVTRSGGHWQ